MNVLPGTLGNPGDKHPIVSICNSIVAEIMLRTMGTRNKRDQHHLLSVFSQGWAKIVSFFEKDLKFLTMRYKIKLYRKRFVNNKLLLGSDFQDCNVCFYGCVDSEII